MATKSINQEFLISGYLEDLTGNQLINLEDSIVSIAIKKDFMTDIMPLFVVNLKVDYATREILRTNDFRIALTIDEFDSTAEMGEENNIDYIPSDNTLNTILKIFDKNIQPIDLKEDPDNDENATSQKFELSFACIPEQIYNRNSKVINDVYKNASNNEILIDILNTENTKLYIDPSDNTDRENTLFIPPLNISKAIEYLQQNYGLYNSAYNLFFDLNTTYLIKKYNNEYIQNKLILNILSQNDLSSSTIYTDIEYDDETGNVTKILKTAPVFTTSADVMSNILGGNAIIGSYGENYELITRRYEYNSDESKVRYYWNPSRSYLFEESQNKIPRIFTTIPLNNISPNFFSILTKVEIESENQDIAGIYNIESIRCVFGTSNYKNYQCTTMLSLSK